MTAGKLERLQKQHREHNKRMKQIHCHSNIMTFDEYVDYVQGNYKPKQSSKTSTTNFDWNASLRLSTDQAKRIIFQVPIVLQVLHLLQKKKQCNTQENVNLLVLQLCIKVQHGSNFC